MKKALLLIFLFLGISLAQTTVRTFPSFHSVVNVYADTAKGAAVTTDAISSEDWVGVHTLFFYADTVDVGTPGTFTVNPQLYNSLRGQWYDYYDATAMVTVAASKLTEDYFYINYGSYTQNAWGDSVRWIITPQSADTIKFTIDVGGQ